MLKPSLHFWCVRFWKKYVLIWHEPGKYNAKSLGKLADKDFFKLCKFQLGTSYETVKLAFDKKTGSR